MITDKWGNYNKCVCEGEYAAQPFSDLKCSRRVQISPISIDQNDRVDLVTDPMLASKLLSDVRLQSRELKVVVPIVANNKINGSIAKIAYAVEQNDRSHTKILPQLTDRF